MPMGDNIREEEQAKVDGLRAVNRMLREQNRVLAREYTRHAGCSRTHERVEDGVSNRGNIKHFFY